MRGFEYYTGICFAGYGAGVCEAVLRGGRYDELLGNYGYDACATGFAVDVEAIAQTERSAGIAAPAEQAAVLIAPVTDRRRVAVRVAAALRERGLRVAVEPGRKLNLASLRAYAERIGCARLLLIDERGGRAFHGAEQTVSPTALRRAAAGEPEDLMALLGLERNG